MITRNRSDRRALPTRRGLSQLDRESGRIAPSHALLNGLGASCASGVGLAIAFPPVGWRRRLSWFDAVSQIPVDRVPGVRIEPLVDPALPAIGTPICFENAFPSLVRDMVKNGAELLVVPVNNASYGFSAASEQHLQMSRMRAVEVDRWVVNAGVSGITAAIDPTGRVVERTQLFETASLRTTVFAIDSRTPFVRWGEWIVVLSFVLLAASWAMSIRRHPVAK